MCFPVFLSAIEDDREGVPTPPDRVPGANALITIRDFYYFFLLCPRTTHFNQRIMLFGAFFSFWVCMSSECIVSVWLMYGFYVKLYMCKLLIFIYLQN